MVDPTGVASDGGMREDAERRLRAQLHHVQSEANGLRARVRWLAAGLLLTFGLALVVALRPDLLALSAGDERAVVETEGLVLVDADGQPRGRWAVDADGNVRLTMLDERQRDRLSISVLDGGFPGLSLINANGQRRAALGLLPDETTSLVFADAAGVPRAVLGLTGGDAANLVFADAQGVSRIGLGLDGSGLGSVMLPDSVEAEELDPGAP